MFSSSAVRMVDGLQGSDAEEAAISVEIDERSGQLSKMLMSSLFQDCNSIQLIKGCEFLVTCVGVCGLTKKVLAGEIIICIRSERDHCESGLAGSPGNCIRTLISRSCQSCSVSETVGTGLRILTPHPLQGDDKACICPIPLLTGGHSGR